MDPKSAVDELLTHVEHLMLVDPENELLTFYLAIVGNKSDRPHLGRLFEARFNPDGKKSKHDTLLTYVAAVGTAVKKCRKAKACPMINTNDPLIASLVGGEIKS